MAILKNSNFNDQITVKIIGIGGTNGAGKDTLADWLASQEGWRFISVSEDLLIPELKKRREVLNRTNMANLSTKWRKGLGMGATIDKAVEKISEQEGENHLDGLVVASLRHPGEADRIHELGGKVVWIDADPRRRYDRIYSRGQGPKDEKTFEQFLAEEQAEMKHRGDAATLEMAAVKEKADIFIQNDTETLEEFIELAKKSLGFDAD